MISKELKTLIDFAIGDGHIANYMYSSGKRNGKGSFHYKIEQSIKQKDYFLHKKEKLESLGFTGKMRENKKVLKGKEYTTISFELHVNDYIKTAAKWIINKKRKAIDKHLLSVLDAESLAYWYMDDGSANKSCKSSSSPGNGFRYYYTYPVPKLSQIRLYTYAFTLEENTLIVEWLKNRFDLEFNIINGTRDGPYLKTSALEQRKKFIDVVKPYIIPSMTYKIDGVLSYNGISPITVYRKRLSEETPTDNAEEDAIVQGQAEPA